MADPTLTPQSLKALITEVMKEHMANPFMAKTKASEGTQIDSQVIRSFKRAGFADVQPRANVKTFNKWLDEGRRPKEGEKSIKVKQFRLFHISQTRPLTKEEISGLAEKQQAAKAPANVTAMKPAKGKGKVQPTLPL
jgi:hypothetical protein